MSLQVDSTKCVPPKPIDDNDRAARECLVFGSISSGIPEITKSNWPEVYARIHLIEITSSAFRIGRDFDDKGKIVDREPVFFTPTEIKRWVGLKTNASTKTRAQFLKRFDCELNAFVKAAREQVNHVSKSK